MKPYLSAAEPAGSAPALARVFPFALYLLFIFADDVLGRVGMAASELRWLYPLRIAAVLAALLACRHAYTELAWQRLRGAEWAGAAGLGIAVFVLWIMLDASWMLLGGSAGYDARGASGALQWELVILRIAGAALVVPVMEELFWRSFLLRWLDTPNFLSQAPQRLGWRPLAISAVLFGAEHHQWLAGIAAGLAYGWLYMRTGKLWLAVIAHGVTNAALGIWIVATGNWHYW